MSYNISMTPKDKMLTAIIMIISTKQDNDLRVDVHLLLSFQWVSIRREVSAEKKCSTQHLYGHGSSWIIDTKHY